MRDIRADLAERAQIIQQQIKAAYATFEKAAQQLQGERDARVSDLKETMATIDKLIQFETNVMGKVVTLGPPTTSQSSLMERIRAVD